MKFRIVLSSPLLAGAISLAWSLLPGSAARAGGGPENLLLVVNPLDAGSLEVANHYQQLRKIPASNVFYLPWKTGMDRINGLPFRESILRPIVREIKKRGLGEQIDQVVYSSGYPWLVDFSKQFPPGTWAPPSRPWLSLTGATFLHELVETFDPQLLQLDNNHYATADFAGPTVTRGFRAVYRWDPRGTRTSTGGTGYLLATALGFSSRSGNTTAEIVAYLRRAAAADGTAPTGAVYFMSSGDIRSRVGQPRFGAAVSELRSLGVEAQIAPGAEPHGKSDIAGLCAGSPNVHLTSARCQLLPGAIVDNLTSAGGQLYELTKPKPQTRLSEFLRVGAAGACGTVVEPFAIPAKFPAPALFVHYARGATLSEAFYLSVSGPFQLLIVGDPLCAPWWKAPAVRVAGLPPAGRLAEKVALEPAVRFADGRQAERFELYVDGKRTATCGAGQTLPLDPARQTDGYHELCVVAIDNSPTESQAPWRGTALVKRGRHAVQLTPAAGDPLAVEVTTTTSAPVNIMHNGRQVGATTTGAGTVRLDPQVLGRGPVELVAESAATEDAAAVRSRPVTVTIR